MQYSFARNTPLFSGMEEVELEKLTDCLNFRELHYKKGETLWHSGAVVTELGLVLKGGVRIENVDFWGNRSVWSLLRPGDVFGEAYALSREPLVVDVIAHEDCSILFLKSDRILSPCASPCPCHAKLIRNVMLLSARMNLNLAQRMQDTASKSVRTRLMSYFSREVRLQGSNRITIPFDRQQLSDYLGLDRSAVSKELSRMKADGLLDYRKNSFVLKVE